MTFTVTKWHRWSGWDIHDLQLEEDARREKVLSEMGLRIVRFRNEEVMKNLSAVVGKIRELVLRSEETSV